MSVNVNSYEESIDVYNSNIGINGLVVFNIPGISCREDPALSQEDH